MMRAMTRSELEDWPAELRLLDCGDGRRLERLGPLVLDRPAPAAERTPRRAPALWARADARFSRPGATVGAWSPQDVPSSWNVQVDGLTLELRRTETVQVGLFLEQVPMWRWIAAQVRGAGRPLTVLNLFGYTGGSSLAAAAAGADVVHVDAARGSVSWAKRNAELTGIPAGRVRFVVEDAPSFVRRELARGRRYDAVILDPPSYGHGPRREAWKFESAIGPLLEACAALTEGQRAFLLLSAHTPGYGPEVLGRTLRSALPGGARQDTLEAGAMELVAQSGARLPSGSFARWHAG